MNKRYIATIELFVFCDNIDTIDEADKLAIKKANEAVDLLSVLDDNSAELVRLKNCDFGKILTREVKL